MPAVFPNSSHPQQFSTTSRGYFLQNPAASAVSFLMSELLNLLFIALHTFGESQATKLIGGALNDELLLVLCHHHDVHVRTATIRLFYAYFSR